MDDTLYRIYKQSWTPKDMEESPKTYLRVEIKEGYVFEQLWRRSDNWTNDATKATLIESRSKANQIAWYYGVAFEEVL